MNYHIILKNLTNPQLGWIFYAKALLVCLLSFNYPIGIIIALATFVIINYKGAPRLIAVGSIFFVFLIINSTKSVETDLESYLNLQKLFAKMNLWEIFSYDNELVSHSGSFRSSEFMGYFIYWIVAKYISDGKTTFEILSLALIYIPGIYAITILSKHLCLSKLESSIVYLAFLFICVNPALVTHVTRQYAAGSFFLLAISLFISKRMEGSFLCLFLAISIHNSIAVVFCVGLAVYYFYGRHRPRIGLFFVFDLRIWKLSLLIFGLLFVSLLQSPNLTFQDDGKVSYITIFFDFALLVYLTRRGYNILSVRSVSVISSVLLGLILLSVFSLALDLKIFSLRFYFYVELIRFFGILLVYRDLSCMHRKQKKIYAYSLAILFIFYFFLKLQFSPFIFAAQGLLLPLTDIRSIGNALIIN